MLPMTEEKKYRDRLLIEIIAEKLGFEWLSEALPGPSVYPPYILVAVGLLIEYGLFDVYNYIVSGKSSWLTQPNSLAIPAMTILAVVGLRYIHNSYSDVILDLGITDDDFDIDPSMRSRFEGLVSFRIRLLGYIAILIIYYTFLVFAIGIPQLLDIGGIGLVLYAQTVSFPFIIIPILFEIGISYAAVHLVVPRRIAKADFGLFYYDPRNLGGFEPVGELLKRSYYIYTAILLLWFLQTHTPVLLSQVTPYPPPGPIIQLALSAAWMVGVVTITYSMYLMHSIMKEKKKEKIRSLEQELKKP